MQGASCLQPKYLKVFKYMNRRVGRARCSTQVFALWVSQDIFSLHSESKDTHYSLYIRLPGLCRSNNNEWSHVLLYNIWCSPPKDMTLMKIDTNTTLHFNASLDKSPFNIARVLALPQDNRVCQLKKPEGSSERVLESIRDRLDSWKMGTVSDAQLNCENPGLFNASAKSLLHTP